jgi:hypothetical protein
MLISGKLALFVSNLLFLRHKQHKKCTCIQEWKDFKTLILKLVGVITFVIGPDSMDLKLRGTWASAVLQCRYSSSWSSSRLQHSIAEVWERLPLLSLQLL